MAYQLCPPLNHPNTTALAKSLCEVTHLDRHSLSELPKNDMMLIVRSSEHVFKLRIARLFLLAT
jgi:hypothetical protein